MSLPCSRWLLIGALLTGPLAAKDLSVATLQDAIGMQRIQYNSAGKLNGAPVAAISPDGEKAAVVVWHGDLQRNANVYTLMLLDLRKPLSATRAARPVLTRAFIGDPDDPVASPIQQLTFLGDNRTLTYLGRDADDVAQAFSVDTQTAKVTQLTHHASAVRAFATDAGGRLLAYAALSPIGHDERAQRLEQDGVFLWDRQQFPIRMNHFSAFPLLWKRSGQTRQYFLTGETPEPFFDSAQSRPSQPLDFSDPRVANSLPFTLADETAIWGWASLKGDPNGRYVLMHPYAVADHDLHSERYAYYAGTGASDYKRRMAAPYGLVDAKSGRIERLIDAPHPQFDGDNSGDPLWLPDGKSVIVYTLLPDAPAAPPQWVEVDVATHAITPLGLAKSWRPIAFSDRGSTLVLAGKERHFGIVRRAAERRWSGFQDLGTTQGFNADWAPASNGHVLIGVKDASLTPPELAAYDFDSHTTTRLSDLNPALHQRRYGAVETLHWQSTHDSNASGFLIKPIGYAAGRRYPLVVLLDDGTLGREGDPFLLDGVQQLGSHAVQMLAAQGFMVLYARQPYLHDVLLTPQESQRMCEHIEAAIAKLDRDGLIDPQRVGLSGWSRAGYYTDYALMHSSFTFAAAATMDGGGVEYNDGMRPFTDEELRRIRTPLLIQPHKLTSLVQQSAMTDRLAAWGKPVDVLYFATASHAITRPQHRLRSLGTHIDWWRFWLQGQVDPDPAKAAQYRHWQQLCEQQKKNNPGSPAFCASSGG